MVMGRRSSAGWSFMWLKMPHFWRGRYSRRETWCLIWPQRQVRLEPLNRKGPTMAFQDLYALSTEGSSWSVKQDFDAVFNWTYDEGRAAMMSLYAKGKQMQWDAATRIDWNQELDADNPEQ